MNRFELLFDHIYRLKVPFADNFTSVFLVRTSEGDALLDCATTESDASDHILPALVDFGANVRWIAVSHDHSDHVGGLPYVAAGLPGAQVCMLEEAPIARYPGHRLLHDGDTLAGCLRVLNLPGHTDHSLGLLDERTMTLLTFDSLQLGGVSRWGTGLGFPSLYRQTIARLRTMEFDNIVAAHEYVPLGAIAKGRAAVEVYLTECLNDVRNIEEHIAAHSGLTPDELVKSFNETHPAHPPIGSWTVQALIDGK
ncbi:MAG: MBL fold metallo-hydrolase [Clostridia bacterium]|nr:MBL fold metallo-hydrolase [Clostridia bacterium]